jgi:hypothetical protein
MQRSKGAGAKMQATDIKMQANDILFVPDSAGKHALHRATDVIISLTSGVAMMRVGGL